MTPARCRNVKEVGQGFAPKLATEAPVNGGRNYDGPKVNTTLALVKPNHMRETPPQPSGTRRSVSSAVRNRRTWGQSAGKVSRAAGETLRDLMFGPELHRGSRPPMDRGFYRW